MLPSRTAARLVKLTSQSVADAVDQYLHRLIQGTEAAGNEEDKAIAAHIDKTFRSHWWGFVQVL
jgi:hypothetical protein